MLFLIARTLTGVSIGSVNIYQTLKTEFCDANICAMLHSCHINSLKTWYQSRQKRNETHRLLSLQRISSLINVDHDGPFCPKGSNYICKHSTFSCEQESNKLGLIMSFKMRQRSFALQRSHSRCRIGT